MDQHHAAGHASADDEYLETPPGSTYEHTDATVWIIVKFLFWLAVLAVIIHFGLGVVYALLDRARDGNRGAALPARGRAGRTAATRAAAAAVPAERVLSSSGATRRASSRVTGG